MGDFNVNLMNYKHHQLTGQFLNEMYSIWPLQKLREDWALAFSDLISGIVWVTSASYNWSTVSKVTVNQL